MLKNLTKHYVNDIKWVEMLSLDHLKVNMGSYLQQSGLYGIITILAILLYSNSTMPNQQELVLSAGTLVLIISALIASFRSKEFEPGLVLILSIIIGGLSPIITSSILYRFPTTYVFLLFLFAVISALLLVGWKDKYLTAITTSLQAAILLSAPLLLLP